MGARNDTNELFVYECNFLSRINLIVNHTNLTYQTDQKLGKNS